MVVRGKATAPPVVALTIDDGLDPVVCRTMFDYLVREQVPATFFPTSVGIKNGLGLWREISAAGFPIGIHGVTHRDLTTISRASVRRQLGLAQAELERFLPGPVLPVWRPPYGAYDATTLEIAGDLGLHTMVLWGPSAGDSNPDARPERMAVSASQGSPGAMVLLHCNHPGSAAALPLIVEAYRARGFGFVTVPQLLRPQGPQPEPVVEGTPEEVMSHLAARMAEEVGSDGCFGDTTVDPDPAGLATRATELAADIVPPRQLADPAYFLGEREEAGIALAGGPLLAATADRAWFRSEVPVGVAKDVDFAYVELVRIDLPDGRTVWWRSGGGLHGSYACPTP